MKGEGRAAAVQDMAALILTTLPVEDPAVVADRIDQLLAERYRTGRGRYDPIGIAEKRRRPCSESEWRSDE